MRVFDSSFDRVFGHEQGYNNDPNDPGGETKYGISKRSYPDLDIKNLSRERTKSIYFEDFWDKIDGENLPAGLAFQLFDFAVHSGVKPAIRSLQKILGVTVDGIMGEKTLGGINHWGSASEMDLIVLLLAARIDLMTSLPNWSHAGKGWARRIAKNLRYAVQDTL